jgi:hypothetical protein
MHWRFIITSQCLRSQISLAGITFQQTLALTCMDALMPWAQGCAGTVQVLADTVRDGVRDLGQLNATGCLDLPEPQRQSFGASASAVHAVQKQHVKMDKVN